MFKNFVFLMCVPFALSAAEPTAAELINILDNNEVAQTMSYSGEMVIDYKGNHFVKTFLAWARANNDFFIEFTNPEDKNTRYLKKSGRLYVWSPDAERVMLISGSMLKESMMGSDMSYEDTVSNRKLGDAYNGEIIASENYNGREAWVLQLTAKDKRLESYPTRKLWVDKANHDLLHAEYFALSGAKLKEYDQLKVEVIGKRRFPVQFEMHDIQRKGSKTTFTMNNVVLDKAIDDSIFTNRNLER